MTNNFNNYVAYIIAPPRRGRSQISISDKVIAEHEAKIKEFISTKEGAKLTATYIEEGNNKRNRSLWPELEKAVKYSKMNKCHLIIAEFGSLISNVSFNNIVSQLIRKDAHSTYISLFSANIYCLDQPYINRENFQLLVQHAQQQKRMHGELIREGLNKTNAKSGNPNAAAVISKVNKPKIDNAIIFALILQPIIAEYKKQKLSQRKMVAKLNEEGFSAPEGGKWVLSQLQKVLERIRTNEKAMELSDKFKLFAAKNYTNMQIVQDLTQENISPLKGTNWSETQVQQLRQRIENLKDIESFNDFVEAALPILKQYRVEELDEHMLKLELEKNNILKTEQVEENIESKTTIN